MDFNDLPFQVRPDLTQYEGLQLSSNFYGIMVKNSEEKKKIEELMLKPSLIKFRPQEIVCLKNLLIYDHSL